MIQTNLNFLNCIETEEYDGDDAFLNYSCRPQKQTHSKFHRLAGDY
jgi:hypothetical protein